MTVQPVLEAAESDDASPGLAARGLVASGAVLTPVGGEAQLARVLAVIAERGRALVQARAMVLLLVEGDQLVITARAGAAGDECLGWRLTVPESVFERALQLGRLESVVDPFAGTGPGLAGLRSSQTLMIPLRYRDRSVGLLLAFAPPSLPEGFRAEHAELLDSIASSAAIAVWTARSVEDDRARRVLQAAEAERTRWARDLHDGTLQGLGALQISLATARRTQDPLVRDRVLTQAADQATEEIAQLRALITDLRPVALDDLGIAAALEALVDRSQRVTGLPIRISTALETGGGRERHVPELETAIYRLVQEALSNAVKHAGATSVHISVRERDDRVELVVEDDGRGFDVHSRPAGFGLIGMRERVALEHGTFRVVSGQGNGTRAEIILPVRRRAS